MSAARYKVREAKYFLEQMRESASSATNRDASNFNLSAFLSATRSVRYFLQAEYEHAAGFERWWKDKESDWPNPKKYDYREIEDPVIAANTYLWHARTITIHSGMVQPTAHFRGIRDGMVDPEGVKYYFVDFRDRDVLTLCTEYLDRLEALVAEAEIKFG